MLQSQLLVPLTPSSAGTALQRTGSGVCHPGRVAGGGWDQGMPGLTFVHVQDMRTLLL